MVQSVNIGQYQTQKSYARQAQGYKSVAQNPQQNPNFGYREDGDYTPHPIKKLALTLANDAFGFIGINLLLWKMQELVNGKILVGKINKHYTKGITETNKLVNLAFEMRHEKELDEKFVFRQGRDGEAFFNHKTKEVVVGKNSYSSLFHEIGHAMIENKTTVLKKLQRFRGNYTLLALGLYTLMAQRPKNNYEDKSPGPVAKVKNFLNKNDYVIPLLAFSPELITEFKASQYGLKFLKSKVKDGAIDKTLFSKIKKSYITCFSTYLFIPVSIMLVDALRNSVNKKVRKYN